MTQTEQLRKNLLDKIKELFQLNQPELDFGFYRIMHSRAREITRFIEHDLFDTIQNAFDSAKAESAQTELEAAKAKLLDAIGEDAFDENGHLKPAYANSKAGREFLAAQQRAAASDAVAGGEESVYYHLYKFFSRYYESGDFISTRYHTRETGSMAKPYAIPYGGEEVMLHWANADQYYIKTTENFNNYTFDLAKAKVFDALSHEERILAGIPDHALMVHFKVVEAEEGEHGNIKADPNKKREFFPARKEPVALNAAGELEIRFEYRQPEVSDAISAEEEARVKARFEAKNKGDVSLLVMTERILAACRKLRQCFEVAGGRVEHLDEFRTALEYPCPTDTVKKRVLLTRYLYQYTARNTSDYFIHKDLRGFLRREMDFYIKNEIMNLDDIENSDVAAVENYLVLLKVFRRIAGKLIDFLGQLEDFQKKLWLKKKFVVQCDCCITLDRVPKTFYPEILCNRQQWEEWGRLGFIGNVGFNDPTNRREPTFERLDFLCAGIEYTVDTFGRKPRVTINNKFHEVKSIYQDTILVEEVDFFQRYPFFMVDTKFFSEDFKARLFASIPDFDEQCDGVLIHSENFQALNLLRERYREQVKCIYIDPPYNTGSDGFIYKDSFLHSSWLSCMQNTLKISYNILNPEGVFFASIGYQEITNYWNLLNCAWGAEQNIACLTWKARVKPVNIGEARLRPQKENDFVLGYEKQMSKGKFYPMFSGEQRSYPCNLNGRNYRLATILKSNRGSNFRSTMRFSINGYTPPEGQRWQGGYDFIKELFDTDHIEFNDNVPSRRYFEDEEDDEREPLYCFLSNEVSGTSEDGKNILNDVIGKFHGFDTVKPVALINYVIKASTCKNDFICDYFAGSGTTGHAVINLNREDGGKRKYILVEMGDHFDTVLKPRLEKVVFARDWKDGKPQSAGPRATRKDSKKILGLDIGTDQLGFALMEDGELTDSGVVNLSNPFNGVSHCFKYMRLESYEDTLNNLTLPEESAAEKMPPTLREDYMLHYLLDTETRDSLLSIRDFANPFGGYLLNIKQPASEASVPTRVDLMETFHYLIGLRVQQYYTIQSYRAEFRRSADPELPDNGAGQRTRLELATRPELNDDGPWRFRKIEGWIPANPLTPNDGRKKNVLIVWRTLTGDLERDNLMLDWYLGDTINLNEKRPEYDIIYVNGSNNLGADRRETDLFQVRLIEEEFLKQMWSGEEC